MTEEPKIIVDDDWKSQVQREKEELAEKEKKKPSRATAPLESQLPPASFVVLVGTLSTQAMAALGYLHDPVSGQPDVNRPLAKHFIDTLAMLEEKTTGNLTPEESHMLTETLHHLRIAYVDVKDNDSGSGDAGEQPPTIQLP
jgi:hypothetical protein